MRLKRLTVWRLDRGPGERVMVTDGAGAEALVMILQGLGVLEGFEALGDGMSRDFSVEFYGVKGNERRKFVLLRDDVAVPVVSEAAAERGPTTAELRMQAEAAADRLRRRIDDLGDPSGVPVVGPPGVRLVEELEAGGVPFHEPLRDSAGYPGRS